ALRLWHRGAALRALCRALALHDPGAAPRLSHRGAQRHRCRPAPQPRQERHSGVGATGSPRTQVTSAALRYHPASFETRQLVLRSRRKRRLEGGAPQDEEAWWIALKKGLILRSPRSGRLEGRNESIQLTQQDSVGALGNSKSSSPGLPRGSTSYFPRGGPDQLRR